MKKQIHKSTTLVFGESKQERERESRGRRSSKDWEKNVSSKGEEIENERIKEKEQIRYWRMEWDRNRGWVEKWKMKGRMKWKRRDWIGIDPRGSEKWNTLKMKLKLKKTLVRERERERERIEEEDEEDEEDEEEDEEEEVWGLRS